MTALKVLLIIPAYNEAENIKRVCDMVKEFSEITTKYELDYIVINDGSSDATTDICEQNDIKAIHLVQNLGIGGAVQTGYIYAKLKKYDIAVQFDGDGQHDIQSLDDLLLPVINGNCDFSIGSRFLKNTSLFKSTFLRRVGIKYLSFITHVFSGVKVTDPTSGYRAANKKVIEFLSVNYPVDYPEPESIVELLKNSFRIREVQVNMLEREGGKSSINSWKSIYYMFKVSLAIVCTSFQRKVM